MIARGTGAVAVPASRAAPGADLPGAASNPGAMTPDPLDVRDIRKHFVFPKCRRIVTNNAASTQPPRELLRCTSRSHPDMRTSTAGSPVGLAGR